eukprot:TRINITY_DN3480_c0_g2_i1.p1 TRINITY_DN3480_c0_g2~~TRINITY_DN3480_c0_g2_i1.p1  ORF type:complete len:323 (-),score=47.74 TRINITY_DN3480_c0_g2_i1:124-1092(-)
MRQAGRYLPEFKEVRANRDFFEVCRTPELASQLTLQPIERFPLDAAIIFSDILVIPQVMGMDVTMHPGEGPIITNPLCQPDDIARVKLDADVSQLQYVAEAIKLTKKKLNGRVPLIGFAGAPWTIMAYMIEGKGSKEWTLPKQWLYKYPEASHKLLSSITDITIQYLIMQAKAGANALQVFDSWASVLSPKLFRVFILPYLNRIADTLKSVLGDSFPLLLFPKGAHFALEEIGHSKYDVISLDWTIDPSYARSILKGKTLQGNLDPCALYGNEESIKTEVKEMIEKFGTRAYIANLGHGLYPTHEVEKVGCFIDAVHNFTNK